MRLVPGGNCGRPNQVEADHGAPVTGDVRTGKRKVDGRRPKIRESSEGLHVGRQSCGEKKSQPPSLGLPAGSPAMRHKPDSEPRRESRTPRFSLHVEPGVLNVTELWPGLSSILMQSSIPKPNINALSYQSDEFPTSPSPEHQRLQLRR
jgi:hypothetical protein